MPNDHYYIDLYNQKHILIVVGQGAWEDNGIADLRVIRDNCRAKGIPVWCDFWGNDVNHDWPWWRKQMPYFMNEVLRDIEAQQAARKKALGQIAAADVLGIDPDTVENNPAYFTYFPEPK